MYVFLLAGVEVTLSAVVIALGNFFCISTKQVDSEAKMEMAVTAAEKEMLNSGVNEDEEEPKENGKASSVKVEEDVNMVKEIEEENNETSL